MNSAGTVPLGAPTIDVTLTDGAGLDKFYLQSAEYDGLNIQNFEFGSGGDVFVLNSAAFSLGFGSADGTAGSAKDTDDIDVQVLSGSGTLLTLNGTAATDLIVLVGTGFESASAMLTSLGSAGSFGLSATASYSAAAAHQLAILWYNEDERRTELSIVTASAGNLEATFNASAAIVTVATFDDADLLTMSGGTSFGSGSTSNIALGG
jgi:hypothetical protein